jgi:Zn-dependent peptidase ImmA (M78 family)/transcriptional regulator with XRE-family HTH domain
MTDLASKLSAARKASGFSARRVSELLWAKVQMSHTTLVNYEKGRTVPPITALAALADFYARPINWFLESGPTLEGIRYRCTPSRLKIRDRHVFEGLCLRWLEVYLKVERHLGKPLTPTLELSKIPPSLGPHEMAKWVREELGIGKGPIWSIVDVLQAFGVRVMEVPTELPIWALAAKLGPEHVVTLNPLSPPDRCRLSAAHELGHILFGDCKSDEDEHGGMETRAYHFASLLLMPPNKLKEICRPRSMVTLVQAKEQFGISLAAMIYAARREGYLPESICKRLWIEFAKRGWKENEPGKVRSDRALRFEQLIDAAMFRDKITLGGVAQIAGVREDELRGRIQSALGIVPDNDVAADGEIGGELAPETFKFRLAQ